MTIEMMAQIAVMSAKSASYVTMRTTSSTGGDPSAAVDGTPAQKRRKYCSITLSKNQSLYDTKRYRR